MDTIPITVNLTQAVIDAMAANTNYQDTITDSDGNSTPNPQSQTDRVAYLLQIFAQQQATTYLTKQAAISAQTGVAESLGIVTGPLAAPTNIGVQNESTPTKA